MFLVVLGLSLLRTLILLWVGVFVPFLFFFFSSWLGPFFCWLRTPTSLTALVSGRTFVELLELLCAFLRTFFWLPDVGAGLIWAGGAVWAFAILLFLPFLDLIVFFSAF